MIRIRWMIRRDMPEVMSIEERSFEEPWTEEYFISALRQRCCIGMVAEHDDMVLGYMIYELHKHRLNVINFAVHPDSRHEGVGSTMIDKLIRKLTVNRRNQITFEVRESNLPFQLFLKKMGFKAKGVIKHYFDDTNEDAYFFIFKVTEEQDA